PERDDDGPWPRPGSDSTAQLATASPAPDAAGLADPATPSPDGDADKSGDGHEHGHGPRRPAHRPEYAHDGHDGWRTGAAAACGTKRRRGLYATGSAEDPRECCETVRAHERDPEEPTAGQYDQPPLGGPPPGHPGTEQGPCALHPAAASGA